MPAPSSAELIDRVDARDHVVGTVRRGEALEAGANFRTTHVFLLTGADEILLQRVGRERARHPGRWGSSVAAYPFAGETPGDAARRRLREELDLDVSIVPEGTQAIRDGRSLKFVSLFRAESPASPSVREPDHVAELGRWTFAELQRRVDEEPSRFTPTFVTLFRAWRTGCLGSAGDAR